MIDLHESSEWNLFGVPLIVLSFDALRLIWKWNIYDVAEHEILLLHAVDVKVSKQSS